jgi:hypothetical protein
MNGIAVSGRGDDARLLVSDGGNYCTSHAISVFSLADGALVHTVGGPDAGSGMCQFHDPCQLCVATDGFVFVADRGNNRIQVLTPELTFSAFVGSGRLKCPRGVAASDAVVVASEWGSHCVSLFSRADYSLLRTFGSFGSRPDQFINPGAVCFVDGGTRIAVTGFSNKRVSVYNVDGSLDRLLTAEGVLSHPVGIACTDANELIVADSTNRSVYVLDDVGAITRTLDVGDECVGVVVVAPATVLVQCATQRCLVYN